MFRGMVSQFRLLTKPLAFILIILSSFMLVSLAIALYQGDVLLRNAFLYSILFTLALGGFFLSISSRGKGKDTISIRSGFVFVVLIWTSVSLCGSLPYYFSGFSFLNALFQSISAFTTTGISLLHEHIGEPLIFWWALSHFLGGAGIIILSIALLPLLGIGGTHLANGEMSGVTKDKLTPRIADTAKYIWIFYIGALLTATVLIYKVGNIEFFDSVVYAMSAISTGGFATTDIKALDPFYAPAVTWIIIFFTFIGSLNFLLILRLIRGNFSLVFKNTEFRTFVMLIIFFTVAVTLVTYFFKKEIITIDGVIYKDLYNIFRVSLFQVVSTISTSNMILTNYESWHPSAELLIMTLFFIGGCAGSTSGGIKIIRHVIMFKQSIINIKQLVHPNGVFLMRINGNVMQNKVAVSVLGFIVVYMTVSFMGAFFLSLTDNIEAFDSWLTCLACLGNYGTAFGITGPGGSYDGFSEGGKMILAFCMILGRLEIFTILMLFVPWFWKK